LSCFNECIECGKPFDETSYTWSMCDDCLRKTGTTKPKNKKFKLTCDCGNIQFTDDQFLKSNVSCRLKDYDEKCHYSKVELVN
jgi:hypothetical protein